MLASVACAVSILGIEFVRIISWLLTERSLTFRKACVVTSGEVGLAILGDLQMLGFEIERVGEAVRGDSGGGRGGFDEGTREE